ncbi:YbaB/EbfC family nucleoid-associated protein [Saccharothrix longispora]|uniref:YbaB/EbfC family nucleoid-associated protein n=1 Tax=Saccharothrix longispora TaxID=33920 RepID=UPI0028FD4DEE|nr:YbaB/EbfC family nucleoid-associated protein [Saccharothrix longispora]MBY8851715.1 YbaB/EbfC family nucleoid-associated protein [Saccharothrix sp. MB29]MDU0294890.1 YbaB/EbfC family nucleoid-associated protein [Saccharothrix longispora]
MSGPLHDEMSTALTDLRAQQDRITETLAQLGSVEATSTSEDRLLQATVDGQGRLTGLKFTGRRWRDLAPKELAAKLVEVVNRAQDQAAQQTASLMSGLMPPGLDAERLRDLGGTDLDALFESAVEDLAAGRWTR